MGGGWSGGSTRRWRVIRAAVLARDQADGWGCRAHDEGWCARSGRTGVHTCTGVARAAHHTQGRAVTGDDITHLVGSCRPCNLFIGEPRRVATDPPNKGVTQWG
jgi:5-methylcytosine-specific restriction endonuclease McrA